MTNCCGGCGSARETGRRQRPALRGQLRRPAPRAIRDVALSGGETVGLARVAAAGVRATDHPNPLSLAEAIDRVCSRRGAVVVAPGPRQARILRGLLQPLTSAGNLVNDADLAALAVQHRCGIVSFDNDIRPVPWSEPG